VGALGSDDVKAGKFEEGAELELIQGTRFVTRQGQISVWTQCLTRWQYKGVPV
jgi:hypothetical protein